jgi:transposase
MRCLKRNVANEVYAALLNPATDHPVGRDLSLEQQRIGIPISILDTSPNVPYQRLRRLRRLEISTRADPELEHQATIALAQKRPDQRESPWVSFLVFFEGGGCRLG